MSPVAHRRVTADRQLVDQVAVYHGGHLLASSGGAATVDIYDGLDTDGDLIDSFRAATSTPDSSLLEPGIAIRRGLYVNLGDNVTSFVLFYEPVTQPKA
jgi:hypothetical protein